MPFPTMAQEHEVLGHRCKPTVRLSHNPQTQVPSGIPRIEIPYYRLTGIRSTLSVTYRPVPKRRLCSVSTSRFRPSSISTYT